MHHSRAKLRLVMRLQAIAIVTLSGLRRPPACDDGLANATHSINYICELDPAKNYATNCLQVRRIPVVTLTRTDTTLDHSQKAEKVCKTVRCRFDPCLNKIAKAIVRRRKCGAQP